MVFLSPIETCFLAPHLPYKLCAFSWEHWDSHFVDSMSRFITETLKGAVPQRRAEFIAGRFLAHALLKEKGCSEMVQTLTDRRDPIWPSDYVGSITHSQDRAACIVLSRQDVCGVGLDLEHWMEHLTSRQIGDMVLPFSGERRILGAFSSRFSQQVTLAFSAKESLFKALYPLVRVYWEFHDVIVHDLEGDGENGRLLVALGGPIFSKQQRFWVYYSADKERVVTAAVVDDFHTKLCRA
jgi:enterobactin synthetase component D